MKCPICGRPMKYFIDRKETVDYETHNTFLPITITIAGTWVNDEQCADAHEELLIDETFSFLLDIDDLRGLCK